MSIPSALKIHIDDELSTYSEGKSSILAWGSVVLVHRWCGPNVTLYEHCSKPGLAGECRDCLVARFHYDERQGEWSLFCQDRNLRWFPVAVRSFHQDFSSLLEEVDRDPRGLFWGWRQG